MAAEPAPAFLFYVRDWLSDAKVRAMSHEARGVYIDLLCYCWQEGALPADPVRLVRIAGLTPVEFRRIWPQLEPCFVRGTNEFTQKRIERERSIQSARRAAFSKNGSKGAAARWQGHDSANGESMAKNDIAFAFAFAREEEEKEQARPPSSPSSGFVAVGDLAARLTEKAPR